MTDWKTLLEARLKAKRQILFSPEDPGLAGLAQLLGSMPGKAVVLWALELAEETASRLEKTYPSDSRARLAVQLSRDWAAGAVKMPAAKRAILSCHAAAREVSNPGDAARFHAVGQGCSTVHTAGHAMGYPVYDLTALVRDAGPELGSRLAEERIGQYICRAMHYLEHSGEYTGPWAPFLERRG